MWFKIQILRWIALAALVGDCLSISEDVLEDTCRKNKDVIAKRRDIEQKLVRQGKTINPTVKQNDISLAGIRRGPFVHSFEANQLPLEAVTEDIIKRENLDAQQIADELPYVGLDDVEFCSDLENDCLDALPDPECDPDVEYRTADGICNNLRNPRWGAAFNCFQRLLRPHYVGASGYRQSVLGGPLPQPRDLSLNVHNHLDRPTLDVTHMFTFFGQLVDHDMTQAPMSITLYGLAIQCCPPKGLNHPQCKPLEIRPNDPFYSEFNKTCMNFLRSAVCPTCKLGYRQQIDQLTSFVDASFVYGNSDQETESLRANDDTGRLTSVKSPVGELLPPSTNPLTDQCSFLRTNDICFLAGDVRVNEHTTLATLQTVFLREHNRIADILRSLNSEWDGDKIFQEARKIVGAQMQAIVYKEYLPIVLGPDRMLYFRLMVPDSGFTRYNGRINPTVINEFSGAAFRFGHTFINSIITQFPKAGTGDQLRLLRDEYFQPFELRHGLITPLLKGVTNSSAQQYDRHLVPDVTNFLYRFRGTIAGLDLAAINIHRGRDHGLPPYTELVKYCTENIVQVKNFVDLARYRLMSVSNAQLLSLNYRHVDDIDLWTGLVSETPQLGAAIGPTAACIVGTQFMNSKFGDRFYFQHKDQAGSFSLEQMQELKKSTLSRLFCANTDVNAMAENVLLFSSKTNPFKSCQDLGEIDLSYWKEDEKK